jgi:GGDEF domain-containing protein
MKYARFEQFVIGIAALAVLAMTIVASRDVNSAVTEGIAGVLLLAVLAAAVHSGRKGGLAAAIAASAVYTVMSIPSIKAEHGLTSHALVLLAMRVATYGLVGIVGGEACARLRHFLTRFNNSDTFDEWSRIFNQRYGSAILDKALSGFERYGHNFCVILLSIAPSVTADLGPQKIRAVVRGVAGYLRGDLRMVDEVARLDDGRFFVLLPNTPSEGGELVAARVRHGVRELLGALDASVTVHKLSSAQDAPELAALADEVRMPVDADGFQVWSGEYNSAGASERKPALDSASSAPGASTLNMSTAAAPEGSTKQ